MAGFASVPVWASIIEEPSRRKPKIIIAFFIVVGCLLKGVVAVNSIACQPPAPMGKPAPVNTSRA